jgi:hypothetical protein
LKKGKKASRDFQDFFLWTRYFRLLLSRARAFFCLFAGLFAKKKEGEAKQKWSPPARARVIDAQKTDHRKKKE